MTSFSIHTTHLPPIVFLANWTSFFGDFVVRALEVFVASEGIWYLYVQTETTIIAVRFAVVVPTTGSEGS